MDRDALTLIARRAEGGVRDALTLLDQVAASGKGPFDEKMVQALLGLSGRSLTFDLTQRISEKNIGGVLAKLDDAYQQGLNLQEIMEELIQHVRNLLFVSTDETLEGLLEATEDERIHYREQVRHFTPEDLLRILRILMDEAGRMRRSPFPRFHMELALAECATLPGTEDLARILNLLGGVESDATPTGGKRPKKDSSVHRNPAPPAGSLGEVDAPPRVRETQPAPRQEPLSAGRGEVRADDRADVPADPQGDLQTDPWGRVISQVRAQKMALATCLASCRIQSFENGELIVERKAGDLFMAQQLALPVHRRLTQDAIKDVFGPATRCRFVEGRVTPAPETPGSEAEKKMDPVRRIARLMDGEIQGPV
ncbi:MAG: hypothetical protein KJ831_19655, partial [Candidatus Eisenbacteria bacterium]|nr:hypothetical protein [Candidatus Eisenbacteria bacterium]